MSKQQPPIVPGAAGASLDLAERLRFETVIAELSSRFVNLPGEDVDGAIADAQRQVCEYLGCDMSGLWQWSESDRNDLMMTHLYRPLGGPPVPRPMLASEYFPWCRSQILAGKTVEVSSLEALPPEAARDKAIWGHFNVLSSLTLPLSVGNDAVVGAVSFGAMSSECRWPEEIVRRIRLVAQVFSNALARKRADDQLRASEERLSLASDVTGAGLWSLDLVDQSFWMTDPVRTMFGWGPDEEVTLDRFLDLVHPEDRGAVEDTIDEIVSSKRDCTVEYRVTRPDGSQRWFMSRGRARPAGPSGPDRMMGVTVDITQRKRMEEVSRDFGRRLINAHEAERAWLACELHDDVTQRLAGMAIDVAAVRRELGSSPTASRLDRLQEGLVTLSEDIHALSYRLHPTILADLGLAEAVRAECERVSRQGPVAVDVDVENVGAAASREVALCLYRVVQEALSNVLRHSEARQVTVSLRQSGASLDLQIRDDGVGFDRHLQQSAQSLGLPGMRERVLLVGGRFRIESEPGMGTTILVRVPAAR